MSGGDPEYTGEILEELVHQFADPVSCFRELIQNSIDAGTSEIDIDFSFEPGSGDDPSAGAIVMQLRDYGSGMDKEIIDERLTRLFSSEKEGDATKIGKFGIGFVSVFALAPDAVIIDTGRAGEFWRIVFDEDRSFSRFALDDAIEGTRVRLIKTGTREGFDELRTRAEAAVRHWCAHVDVELRFDGKKMNEKLDIEGLFVHRTESATQTFVVGHAIAGKQIHGFYNSGITLEAAPEVLEEFSGLSFKVLGGDLEHTLTRDGVVHNEAFHHALEGLRALVDGPVRTDLLTKVAESIKQGKRGPELAGLYGAAAVHMRRVFRQFPILIPKIGPLPLLPRANGDWMTIAELREHAYKSKLRFARSPSPAARFIDKKHPVLICDDNEEVLTFIKHLSIKGAPIDIDQEAVLPDFDTKIGESSEAQRLCTAVTSILEAAGANLRSTCLARFRWPGSTIAKQVAITLLRRDRPAAPDEVGALGHGFFSRERELVLNADHSLVKEALIASRREPEIAAYLVVKGFRLDRPGRDERPSQQRQQDERAFAKHDNARIGAAWELRCRRLGS